jgi:SAM-dependent methyltransferase
MENSLDITQHISRRTRCPLCLSAKLSPPKLPHQNLAFPLLPVCVDTPPETDQFVPFTICICENCGVITLLDVVDPAVLYQIFHSDGIGGVWDEHYERFAALIRRHHRGGRVVEVGAGQGKLIRKLLPHYAAGIEVIDPQYEGPREGVIVHDQLSNVQLAKRLEGQFDSFVSSHTLEHFIEFDEYFTSAWTCLKEGGLLFTSVPNQEAGFAKGYGNMLNFEHSSVCTNLHWIYLHYKNGFVIKEISLFRGHSIMLVAQKVAKPVPFELDVGALALQLLEQYTQNINARIEKVRALAKTDKPNWLFGASNFSQPLFVYGLESKLFAGVLDNSPLKHNKRLYGTSLICRKPSEILGQGSALRIFLNLGNYNDEVRDQLVEMDGANVECIAL